MLVTAMESQRRHYVSNCDGKSISVYNHYVTKLQRRHYVSNCDGKAKETLC